VDPAAGLPYETQVTIAGSPQTIKGYGPIKDTAVRRWREDVRDLLTPAPAVGGGP
jgi:indolepyruvate ferredoxin oxidoreductase